MFEAEIVGHTVVLASNLQNKMAFNAYGEVVFMLAQNAVLLALIYRSAPPKAARTAALWGAYFAAVAAHVAGACLVSVCAATGAAHACVCAQTHHARHRQVPCRPPRWRRRTACPTWCFGTRACRRSWPTHPPKAPARSPASPPPCRPRAAQVRVVQRDACACGPAVSCLCALLIPSSHPPRSAHLDDDTRGRRSQHAAGLCCGAGAEPDLARADLGVRWRQRRHR